MTDPVYSSIEIEAAKAYRSDSTFMHAISQGWNGDDFRTPDYEKFMSVVASHAGGLDSAIAKSPLPEAKILYSGHGKGRAAVGALIGDPRQFVGLIYAYPGFISTSSLKSTAEDFLSKRVGAGSRPVFLELHLPEGFFALDMSKIEGGGSEFEFLIGRNQRFLIVDAGEPVGILYLRLKPAD